MKIRYLAIEREYGSGGTTIARSLSRETGIPCYGPEILEYVANKYHRSVSDIQRLEESATGSLLYSLYTLAQLSSGNADMLTEEGRLYVAEQEAIQHFARQGPAIFLGHCAAEALKGQKGVVRVFIRCTDRAEKHARIAEEYGIPERDIEETKRKFDKKRSGYYYANTTKKWDDSRNYDMILDSAVLGTDTCVHVLKACLS